MLQSLSPPFEVQAPEAAHKSCGQVHGAARARLRDLDAPRTRQCRSWCRFRPQEVVSANRSTAATLDTVGSRILTGYTKIRILI